MTLYHLSTKRGLRRLTPRVPKFRLKEEPKEATICFADKWWKCAMLCAPDAHGNIPLYLYRYEGDDAENQGNKGWVLAELEYRVCRPVSVTYVGELDYHNPLVKFAFSHPCGNCGGPCGWCDSGSHCDNSDPKIEEVLMEFGGS